jgi:hypothetical protein
MLVLAALSSTNTLAQLSEEQLEGQRQDERDTLDRSIMPPDDEDNAAVLYRQAFDELITIGPELDAEWMAVMQQMETTPGPETYQTPAVRRILARHERAIELARQASTLDYTDFGLDRSQGFNTLLPHTSMMRSLSRLLNLQSNMERANGRMSESAAITAALLQVSQDVSSDGIMITSLVGVASAQLGFDTIDDAIARGDLDAESAAIILKGLGKGTQDPYRFSETGVSELDMIEVSMELYEDPGPGLAADIEWLSETNEDSLLDQLQMKNPEEMKELLDQARPGFELGADAFLEPDPAKGRAMIAELNSGLAEGEYGLLAKLFIPDYEGVFNAKLRADEQFRKYRTILDAIASGEDPNKFANAAILYQQAFPHLASITGREQELLEMVRKIVSVTGSCDAIPEAMLDEIRSLLEQSAPVLSILHRAARFEQCNWMMASHAADFGRVIPMGEWVRPMRAAVRFILADAALAVCLAEAGGDDSDVARAISDALAVALHLGDGSHLMSSTVSAATLEEVVSMAESILAERAIEAEDKKLLTDRFARLDGGDPLGWKSARKAMLRSPIHEIVMRYGLDDPEAASRLASNWNNERLVSIAFYQGQDDTTETGYLPPFPRNWDRGELFAIHDVVEIDDESHQRLGSAHERLIELLQILDTEHPIDTTRWAARGNDAISRLDELLDVIEVTTTENQDSGTE